MTVIKLLIIKQSCKLNDTKLGEIIIYHTFAPQNSLINNLITANSSSDTHG